MPAPLAPRAVRVDVVGGDPLGRGDRPALSWWLPEGATRQTAYRIATDDGYDTGVVESERQSYVEVPVFDRSRRSCRARVTVWTDLGQSPASEPVLLESGLLDEADWSAHWIAAREAGRSARWFRSVVDVPAGADARLHVTALGLYEAFLNGRRVGDVELAPGYTQYARRVQRLAFDVTALLRPGPNVIAVLVADGWYRGQVGAPRATDQFGSQPALRLQLEARDGPGWTTLAATGEHWQTGPSHVLAADLIAGQHEDRRLVDPSVHETADPGWGNAVEVPVDVAVVGPVAPPVRRVEDLRPVAVARRPDGASIVDLGQNVNGWTRVRDLGPSGTTLVLRHGEHLDADGDLTTTHLDVDLPVVPDPLPLGQVDVVTSAGRPGDAFEPRFTTHGFRYVRVEGHPGTLTPDDVTGVVVHSDLRRTGWFACSDERVRRLHDAVVWSLRGNVCDIPTDCPQRERAGWTGDWQVFAPTAAALYDVLGFSRKWLRDVALDQRADGCVANMSPCPPAEGFDGPIGFLNGSAGWGDVVVATPWDLYQAYGDLSLLRESWPAATRWLDFAIRGAAQGRHPDRAARRPVAAPHEEFLWDIGFHWGEWLEPGVEVGDFRAFVGADKSEVATAYLHRSAATMVQVGELLGEDVERYRRVAEGARAAWQAEFVAADGTLRVRTQASHVRALAFGLVPDDLRPAVADALVRLVAEAGGHLGTGFLSTGLLLPTLAASGHADAAYELLLQDTEPSWLAMIDRGATTMWERWDGVDADGVAHASLNHYSKGAVASFLHRHVAGLEPTAPGYRALRVRPVPGGGLTWATLRHDSPFGPIEVAWRIEGGGFELDVQVPPGTSAELVLPDGSRETVGPGAHRRRVTGSWPRP
ncbi:family 78 glycoside hydrolase catalytic domain [Cellulomonas sp. ICMP 17802]|uniref:family 78 glycoside hydrolase catalytic domain n=1 Tax=Cellulomonas sp. ICMP 17802 TaxID=3239199 RepID=UPI00351B2B68